ADMVADPEWFLELTRQTHKRRFVATGGALKDVLKLEQETDQDYYPGIGPAWTKTCVLPGGDIDGSREDYAAKLRRRYPFLTESL
ncbi:hypothetical protein MJN51_34485, partial [Salmonella enterica subsp. enterica serovar Kentucky]|nr:hypothetical protein [Salmonella enterica subsp. enterica serovar Kentucky]